MTAVHGNSASTTAKMSNENGDDTVMDDAQESQNGEQAEDELELDETKLFLV